MRTQQEQEAAARALPGTKCCLPTRLPTISSSTRITAHPELWHTIGAIPRRKRQLRSGRTAARCCQSPRGRGRCPAVRHPRHLPRTIWVPQSPNLPAWPLPSPHPTATPRVLTAAEQSLFHREPAHGSREHSRWWTSVASRSRNPNQVTAEAEWKPAQDCLWEALDSPRPGSAVNVF